MTKKQAAALEGDAPMMEIAEMGAVALEASDDSGQPFILGTWEGLTQWRCRFCAWDTLEGEAKALEHYISRHVGTGV